RCHRSWGAWALSRYSAMRSTGQSFETRPGAAWLRSTKHPSEYSSNWKVRASGSTMPPCGSDSPSPTTSPRVTELSTWTGAENDVSSRGTWCSKRNVHSLADAGDGYGVVERCSRALESSSDDGPQLRRGEGSADRLCAIGTNHGTDKRTDKDAIERQWQP